MAKKQTDLHHDRKEYTTLNATPSYLLISPRRETAFQINKLLAEFGIAGSISYAADVLEAQAGHAGKHFDAFFLDVAGPGAFNGDASALKKFGGEHTPVIMVEDEPDGPSSDTLLPKNVNIYINLHSSDGKKELLQTLSNDHDQDEEGCCSASLFSCMQMFFETSKEAVVFLDTDNRVLTTNASFTELFGFEEHEARGEKLHDLIVPEHAVGKYEGKSEAVLHGETLRLSKTGRSIRVSVGRRPLSDKKGQKLGALVVYEDMEPHIKALEARLKGVSNYRDFFMSAPEGLYTCNSFGRFIAVNPAMAEILGYEGINDLTLNVRNMSKDIFVCRDDREGLMKRVKKDGSVLNVASKVYKKDGSTILVTQSITAVHDDDGELLYYLGVMSPGSVC
jgi:PAS domain S-box-containing protein